MTTRDQRASLPLPDNVETILDDAVLARIFRDAKIKYSEQEILKFGRAIRLRARAYLEDARSLSPGEIRDRLADFSKAVTRAIDSDEKTSKAAVEQVATKLDALDAEVRKFMNPLPSRPFPTSKDVLGPATRYDALRLLYGMCGQGGERVRGKKRKGGKRSRDTFKKEFAGPKVRRGHPPKDAEVQFCAWLAIGYSRFTGKRPHKWRIDKDPFIVTLYNIFDLICPDVSVDWTVRTYFGDTKKGAVDTEFDDLVDDSKLEGPVEQ